MATFTLIKDTTTSFECDPLGKVKKGGNDFGTWSTNKENHIVIKGKDGSKTPIDVVWKFNNFNQLCIHDSADKLIYNFHGDAAVAPFFSAPKAVLNVFPSQDEEFSFELRGEWDMSATHDLQITIDGVVSVLDGYVDDPDSKFSYHFFDKNKNPFNIIFEGEWATPTADDKGVLKIEFKYTRENGTSDTLSLPEELTIDRGINQFVYQYSKKNRTRRIRLVGLLNVTEDFRITYSIDRQEGPDGSGTVVKATTFEIKAQMTKSKFEGDIEFVVKKTDGKNGKTVLGIKGSFTARPGANNVAKVGFEFTQERGGDTEKTTVLFNGSLSLKKNLLEVDWSFEIKDSVKTLTVTISSVQLGPVSADSKIVLRSANGEREVLVLLGFRF